MNSLLHDFATRPAILRQAIESHRAWIESTLAAPLSDSVIIETELDFSQLGVEKVLGVQQDGGAASKSVRRLRTFVASAEVPPGSVPLLGYSRAQPDPSLRALLTGNTQHRSSRVEWLDCPIALKLHSIEAPV